MNFGIVGLGNHSLNRVMPAIVESGNKISAVTTGNKEKGREIAEKFSCEYYDSYDRMLQSNIDAVYIGSPNFLHYSQSMRAINFKKHILIEKPMTLKSIEASEINEFSKKNEVKVAVGFHLRFHPAIELLKQHLNQDGETPIIVNGYWGHGNTHTTPEESRKWWSEEDKVGGGSVMGTGVHVIDSIMNIYRKFPRKVTAYRFPEEKIIDESMMINLQFEGGFASAFSSRSTNNPSNDLFVMTKNNNYRIVNFYSTGGEFKFYKNGQLLKEDKINSLYRSEVEGFVNFVENKNSLIASGKDGYNVVRIVEEAQKFISLIR